MKERSEAVGRPISGRLVGAALGLGLVAAVASLGLFTWLADEVVERDTQAIDDWLLLGLHGFATPWLTELMRVASVWGAPSRLAIFGAAAAAYFLVRGWRRGVIAGYSAGTIWVAAVALADRVAEHRRVRRGLRSEPSARMFNPPAD